jgi:hypothetical protein
MPQPPTIVEVDTALDAQTQLGQVRFKPAKNLPRMHRSVAWTPIFPAKTQRFVHLAARRRPVNQ